MRWVFSCKYPSDENVICSDRRNKQKKIWPTERRQNSNHVYKNKTPFKIREFTKKREANTKVLANPAITNPQAAGINSFVASLLAIFFCQGDRSEGILPIKSDKKMASANATASERRIVIISDRKVGKSSITLLPPKRLEVRPRRNRAMHHRSEIVLRDHKCCILLAVSYGEPHGFH